LPDLFAAVDFLRTNATRPLPNYVGVNPVPTSAPASSAGPHEAFYVLGDPNDPSFRVPDLALEDRLERVRLDRRMTLRQRMDGLRRAVDRRGERRGDFDAFQTQAWQVVTGPAAPAGV